MRAAQIPYIPPKFFLRYQPVLQGAESEVLDALTIDDVQAVIILDAWSKPSLRFAAKLAKEGHPLKATADFFQNLKSITDQNGKNAKAFRADLDRLTSVFAKMGERLKLTSNFQDWSRVEPSAHKPKQSWRAHEGSLRLFSMPVGPGIQFLKSKTAGTFNGIEFRPRFAIQKVSQATLGNGSVMISKGGKYPFQSNDHRGLIYREPALNSEAGSRAAQVVIEYRMG